MKVLVQWTKTTPEDWVEVEVGARGAASRTWRDLSAKPAPTDETSIDDQPGHLMAVCVQGVELVGYDHVALTPDGNGLRVWAWSDQPASGVIWTFQPSWVDRTFPVSGLVVRHQGLDQRVEVYDDTRIGDQVYDSAGLVPIHPWSAWVSPDSVITRHGVQVSDALFEAHQVVRRSPSWREWT